MYAFITDVSELIDEMINVFGINSVSFYKGRINNFFTDFMGNDINRNKPLDAITYFDIETYLKTLKCSDAEKLNVYNALKRFFEYTYLNGITKEIMSQVTKPVYIRKPKEILKEDEYLKLKNFIVSRENSLYDRLILGLFLFTGLSRKYIANLRNNDFKFENGVYELIIWKNNQEVRLPIKPELQLIINEYCISLSDNERFNKVINIAENYLSECVSNLIKPIIGRRCSPTILSNTFISKALSSGNHIYEVSKLTLESITTIEKHVKDDISIKNKQTSILNSF